jgi:hypothetical protein
MLPTRLLLPGEDGTVFGTELDGKWLRQGGVSVHNTNLMICRAAFPLALFPLVR